jgi:hypothetical protein
MVLILALLVIILGSIVKRFLITSRYRVSIATYNYSYSEVVTVWTRVKQNFINYVTMLLI